MSSEARPKIPEGMTTWLGDLDVDVDFEFRPGEASIVHGDDPVAEVEGRRFRDVLGLFASGVAVVTSLSDDVPVGMTHQVTCGSANSGSGIVDLRVDVLDSSGNQISTGTEVPTDP